MNFKFQISRCLLSSCLFLILVFVYLKSASFCLSFVMGNVFFWIYFQPDIGGAFYILLDHIFLLIWNVKVSVLQISCMLTYSFY